MVMEAQPSPQSVGREFVRQYYTLLNKAPDHLHRFYNNSSSFVHGGLDTKNQEATLVIGQKQIHNKIQQLNFRDCHAKISQVDSQATLGNGVVVQVTGELSNDGQPMRRFTQTFVLAAQSPKKYYVHNDIFRYQDIYSDDELDENERSGEEDGGEVDANNAVVVDQQQSVQGNAVASAGGVAPGLGQTQQQPQQPQQQQQQLYYPPGVMSAAPTGIIPSYGQPQPAQQSQQPQQTQQPQQQQLNGVHDDLLKTVPTQTTSQLMQSSVAPQNPTAVMQQVPSVATGMPTVDPIQHLTQQQQVVQPQQSAPQQTLQQPQQMQQPSTIPQQTVSQQPQPTPIAEPEPIPSSLSMNELDSALPSMNDPTPAEASDSHDHHHHHHHHGQSDHLNEQPQSLSQQQPLSNEPKTYANLVKSGGVGSGPGPLSFASVSSHHHQQQQSHHQSQGYSNVTAGRPSVMSPPPSSSLQSSSSNNGGPTNTVSSTGGGLGGKYDRGQQQQSSQQQQQQDQSGVGGGMGQGPMPQRMQNQQRPIRGNGGPTSGGGQSSLRPQDSRPSYQRSYNSDGEDRRQQSGSQFGDNHQLFLGNIPHHATEEELSVLFSKYGTVVDLRIHSKPGAKVPGVRAPPNYGFITYEDPSSVQSCLADTPLFFPDNSPDGQKLNVEEKKTRMRGPGETGGRMGGSNLGGNGSGPRGGPGGPGGQQRGGPGGPQGNMNRGGSGQRGLGGVGAGGGGSGRGGYQRSDRSSVTGGGQRSGNGNVSSNNSYGGGPGSTYGGRR
ncbi:ras GTPase-activating protein-binding protein 1 [Aedes albopictus]|uniref:Rasputin n=1 Tax=Aedes albopictus TaxID=7160 RepID=A0ABM2A3Y0_AEDAL|nr:ras GTPase-activating protein-binding protein 1 isoform X1 [Aedes albopictus]